MRSIHYPQAFDREGLAYRRVHVEQHRRKDARAWGHLESARHLGEELLDGDLLLDPDHGLGRPDHADIGEVRRALGQDPLVGRLDVCVGSEHPGDFAIQVPAHGHLLGGRFGVHVHDHGPRLLLDRLDLVPDDPERAVHRGHGYSPHHLHHPDFLTRGGRHHDAAEARHSLGIVGGPQEPGLVLDVVDDLLLVPDVIAAREHVHTRREQLPRHVRRDAEPTRGVFRVGDDTGHSAFADEPRHLPGHGLAPRLADDVADEENFHAPLPVYLAMSVNRLSRMIVTLIWPGYVSSCSILRARSRDRTAHSASVIASCFTITRISRPAWMAYAL